MLSKLLFLLLLFTEDSFYLIDWKNTFEDILQVYLFMVLLLTFLENINHILQNIYPAIARYFAFFKIV